MNFKKLTASMLALGVAFGTVVTGLVALPPAADAAVVRPFTANYSAAVYGDYLLAGNGNHACPTLTSPVDPFGEPIANCADAQSGASASATAINDSYFMRWADVDASAATYNSSQASITIPTGAKVAFARLSWSGNTGTIRLADGTISALPGCNTRQFLAGAGTSVLPSGTPESTSSRLTIGTAATAVVAPQVISRDALANVPASQPQFYSAYATVTNQFVGAPTGSPLPITVGNVWSPQGFGCYSGWSLTLVYSFDAATPAAPGRKQVMVYDGHVRQSSIDPTTTVALGGFRAAATGARVGVTGFEGDANISGDQFLINGASVPEPNTSSTTNYFNSRTDHAASPAVANNLSVDAKSVPAAIPVGASSATLSLATSGDTFLAAGLVASVPIASLMVSAVPSPAGPYREGDEVEYTITVDSPDVDVTGVVVDSPIGACDRTIGALAAGGSFSYDCTAAAPADDVTYTTTATGQDSFGGTLTGTTATAIDVAHPAVTITKTADKATYQAGETITFSIDVLNAGDVDLTDIAVTDAKVPACDNTHPALAVDASFTYTCTATAPLAGNANTASVTADSVVGEVNDSSTASVPVVGTIGGRVFADRNDNGVQDGDEAGISGVTLTLTSPVASTRVATTGPNGGYAFDNVAAGTYTLTQTQPAAYDDGQETAGTNASLAADDSVLIILSDGQSSTGNLFAEQPTSSLAGAVYLDEDDDGTRDAGEPGIAGVTVTLTGTDLDDNDVTFTTTTATDGAYAFAALRPGSYQLTQTQPPGYADGATTEGSAGGTATPNTVSAITLPARTTGSGYLFGEVAGELAGEVYADRNANGVRDPGEAGIEGVSLTLTGTDATGAITPVAIATAADGSYAFRGLRGGSYTLTQTQPAGYRDGSETPGTAGGTTSGIDAITGIELDPGERASGYLFAEERGSIRGQFWLDEDGDGVQEPGEPSLDDVTVHLTQAGNPIATTQPDTDGSYRFLDLEQGSYQVSVETGAGRALTAPGRGTAQTGSDLDWITGLSDELVIDFASAASANLVDIDAGLIVRADDLAVDLQLQQGAAKAAGKARMKAGSGVKVGDTVALRATVTNRGASPAIGVRLTVTLPSGLRPDTADGDDWTCTTAGQSTECLTTEPVLPGAALPTVTLKGTAVSAGTGSITARVAFTDGSTDVTQVDNVADAALTIQAAPVPPVDPDDENDDPSDDPSDDPGDETGDPAPTDSDALPQTGASAALRPAIGVGLLLLAAGLLLIRRRRLAAAP